MSESFSAEPCFYESEAFCSYSFLHLGEMGLAGGFVPVAASRSEVGVASEALHQVQPVMEELPPAPQLPAWNVAGEEPVGYAGSHRFRD